MDQKPTIGRIVHYTPTPAPGVPANKGQPYAAVITHVWGDTVVNLEVIQDGSYPLPENSIRHPTSVPMGSGNGCWCWPPRI